jgi:hypothetical protein
VHRRTARAVLELEERTTRRRVYCDHAQSSAWAAWYLTQYKRSTRLSAGDLRAGSVDKRSALVPTDRRVNSKAISEAAARRLLYLFVHNDCTYPVSGHSQRQARGLLTLIVTDDSDQRAAV